MWPILYNPYKSFLFQSVGAILLCRYCSIQRKVGWITRIKVSADESCLSKTSILLPRGRERSSNSSPFSPAELAPNRVCWELLNPWEICSSNQEGLVLLFPAPHISLSRSWVAVRMGAGPSLSDGLGLGD